MKKINVYSAHSAAGPGLWGRMEHRRRKVPDSRQAGRQENSARHRKEDKWARCGSADWGDGTYKPGGSTLERKEPGLSYLGN